MSNYMDKFIEVAKADKKTIILPESNDERTLLAAKEVLAQDIANIILIGDPATIDVEKYQLQNAQIINPATSEKAPELANLLYETRKHKGMTLEEATAKVADNVWFGILMIKAGLADGLVSGACHPTIDVLSPALRVLKTAPGVKTVSSFFLMCVPNCTAGDDGVFFFSDPALCIQPTEDELVDITLATAQSFKDLMGYEPRIAMLSHSTYGSAKNDDALKVAHAAAKVKEIAPELKFDGEMQADAALDPSVGQAKAPGSEVAGYANTLIFPDLDAANIGYKLVKRLANATAYGPILQGLAAPVNDLSRGCTADEIVGTIALTCIQAQAFAAKQGK